MTTLPNFVDVDADLATRVRIFLISARNELGRLNIRVRDGVVTLAGSVPTFYLRQLATACARRVAGVRNVIDHIEVRDCDGCACQSAPQPHAFSQRGRAH